MLDILVQSRRDVQAAKRLLRKLRKRQCRAPRVMITDTLASYARVFGADAPADLWPTARRRLFHDPAARRVHPRDAFILPRRPTLIALALLAAVLLLLLMKGS